MTLYGELPYSVDLDGKTYPIRPEWPNVLAAIDVMNDEELTDAMQVETALGLLVAGSCPLSARLLKAIFETLNPDPKPHKEKVMDFRQDWALIYAGFRQAYGIDLFAEQDMHWMQFVALLQGLPNSTMLSRVMEIRTMKVPAKASAEYRARISQLKAEYALRSTGSVQNGLAALFESLKTMAKGGD